METLSQISAPGNHNSGPDWAANSTAPYRIRMRPQAALHHGRAVTQIAPEWRLGSPVSPAGDHCPYSSTWAARPEQQPGRKARSESGVSRASLAEAILRRFLLGEQVRIPIRDDIHPLCRRFHLFRTCGQSPLNLAVRTGNVDGGPRPLERMADRASPVSSEFLEEAGLWPRGRLSVQLQSARLALAPHAPALKCQVPGK